VPDITCEPNYPAADPEPTVTLMLTRHELAALGKMAAACQAEARAWGDGQNSDQAVPARVVSRTVTALLNAGNEIERLVRKAT
jgi:hypothetical protein